MNMPDHQPSTNSTVILCGHCAGHGRIESMDYGGTSVCEHCHGSGVEASEPCNMCRGNGHLVNRNHDAFRCPTCDGVGRMPRARILVRPEERALALDYLASCPPHMSFRYAPPADASNLMLQTPVQVSMSSRVLPEKKDPPKRLNRFQILKQE